MTKSPSLVLYYFDACPYCQRVMTTIKRLRVKVDYQNIMEDEAAMEKLVEDTGRRTVPCLYIDGRPMHESQDIMNWLEENQATLEKSS